MAIRDKETGREIDVADLVYQEMGSEQLAIMSGRLLRLLCEKGTITEQDAIDLTFTQRWAEVSPSLQDSEV